MRSYTVAICENEEVQALFLKKLVEEYAQQHSIQFQLTLYESAEAFLFEYEENKTIDLILLDIQMNDIDGLTMAEKIRASHDQVKIVFITGLTEHIGAGYRVEASDYLIKPVKKEQLYAAVDRVLLALPTKTRTLIFPTADEQVKVAVDSIVYAEVVGREVKLTTTNKSYLIRKTMQELKKELNDSAFIVPERSWLIHCGHIERVGKIEVIMDNGMTVPISRRNVKAVNQAFINYYRR